jgi:Holliday junction resolvase
MRTIGAVTPYERILQELADAYKQRGYRVMIAPASSQLPDFLRAYRPDLIAENSDESVVIEIKSRVNASEKKYWAELAEVVRQHPGWRLEIVVGADQDTAAHQVIERPEIEERLREGLQLSEANRPNASLLITWSAVEAAMRLACEKHRVDLPDYRPGTLITKLYTDGLIDREDYDRLMRYMHMRDAVAHGLRQSGVDSAVIKQLHHISLRLLRSTR